MPHYRMFYTFFTSLNMSIPAGETRPALILAEEGKVSRVRENNGYYGSYELCPNKPY